jgi:Predicted integral membrane protein (DUF2270)
MTENSTDAQAPQYNAAEIGALAHLYRGEMYRSTVWRTRLDTTTNWSVVTIGIALSVPPARRTRRPQGPEHDVSSSCSPEVETFTALSLTIKREWLSTCAPMRSFSSSGEPIMNEPAGRATISGHHGGGPHSSSISSPMAGLARR